MDRREFILNPEPIARSRHLGRDQKDKLQIETQINETIRPHVGEAAAHSSIQSAHFSTLASPPQGMIGTEEVEFFGEPSISLSE
jgi:hypothetical protein